MGASGAAGIGVGAALGRKINSRRLSKAGFKKTAGKGNNPDIWNRK